jgi:probable HAF family extracellular repeat protein
MISIAHQSDHRGPASTVAFRRVAALTVSVALLSGGASSVSAQGTFQGLGFLDPAGADSVALGVSPDGSVAVGYSEFAHHIEAFRWSGGTMTGLGFLDPLNPTSFALATSINGAVVVGKSLYGPAADNVEAFRWSGGTMTGLGFLDPANPHRVSTAAAVSYDGGTIVGYSSFDGSTEIPEAVRWTGGGISRLGFLDPLHPASIATGVSADGSVVVGASRFDASSNHIEGFRWSGGVMTGLGFLDPGNADPSSYANGISGDGKVIVGYSAVNDTVEAIRWRAGTMTGLGFLHPGNPGEFSAAFGASYDGSTIVGQSGSGGVTEAFRWTGATGMQSIAGLLTQGGVNLTGWQLLSAYGVSATGATIVGFGFDPSNDTEAWIARLGPEPGFITPAAVEASAVSLGAVPQSATDRLASVLAGETDFAEHNSCGAAPQCAFAIGSANDGLGVTGLFGAEFDVAPGIELGVGAGYGVAHDDLIQGGNADLRFPTVGAFVAHAPETGLQVIAAANAMSIEADINRGYMNGSGSAISSGSTTGDGYGALARFGWAFQPAKPVTVTPFAQYDVTYENLDGYTETGGPFPATVDAMRSTVQASRLGAETHYALARGASLWSSLDWAHRFGDASPAIGVSIPGLFGLTTPANGSGPDWLEASAGVKLPLGPRTTFNGRVTLAAFSQTTPTVEGDLGIGARF